MARYTLGNLFVNVDNAYAEEMQEWMKAYTDYEDGSFPISSRKSIPEQHEKETRLFEGMRNTIIIAMIAVEFTMFCFTLLLLVISTPILLVFAILILYLRFKNIEK